MKNVVTINLGLPSVRTATYGDLTFDVFRIKNNRNKTKKHYVHTQRYKSQRPLKVHFGSLRDVNKTRKEFLAYAKVVLKYKDANGSYLVNNIMNSIFWNLRYCYNNKWGISSITVGDTRFEFKMLRYEIPEDPTEQEEEEISPEDTKEEEQRTGHHTKKKRKRR